MCAKATYIFACCEKPYEQSAPPRVSLANQLEEQQQTHSQQPSHKAQHKVGYTRTTPQEEVNIMSVQAREGYTSGRLDILLIVVLHRIRVTEVQSPNVSLLFIKETYHVIVHKSSISTNFTRAGGCKVGRCVGQGYYYMLILLVLVYDSIFHQSWYDYYYRCRLWFIYAYEMISSHDAWVKLHLLLFLYR